MLVRRWDCAHMWSKSRSLIRHLGVIPCSEFSGWANVGRVEEVEQTSVSAWIGASWKSQTNIPTSLGIWVLV